MLGEALNKLGFNLVTFTFVLWFNFRLRGNLLTLVLSSGISADLLKPQLKTKS